MKLDEARALIAVLAAGYPGRNLPDSTLELYTDELARLTCQRCAGEAVREAIRDSRFFPTIAEVLACYREEISTYHAEHSAPAIESEASWTEYDAQASDSARVQAIAEWRARHPRTA